MSNKPPFNPNAGFTAADRPPFNPNAPLDSQDNTLHGGPEDTRVLSDKLMDPAIWKKIAFGDPNQKIVQGTPPMALPVGALGRVGQGIQAVMESSAPARIAASGAAGAAQDPEHPVWGAVKGAGMGMLGEGLAKGTSALVGGAKRAANTLDAALNPSGAQEVAGDAIQEASKGLRSSMQNELQPMLEGKTVKIAPHELLGRDPEIDSALMDHIKATRPYGDVPSEMEIPASMAQDIKAKLTKPIPYKQGTVVNLPQDTADKYAQNEQLAGGLRGQLRGISGDVSDLYDQWGNNLNQASQIESNAAKRPIAALTGIGGDKAALLQNIDDKLGTDLTRTGSVLKSADRMRNGGLSQGVAQLIKQGSKGGIEGLQSNGANTLDPLAIYLKGLSSKSSPSQGQ